MATTNIRVSERIHTMLSLFAKQKETSMQYILEEAMEDYKRKQILEETNKAFALLKKDKKAWKIEQEERALSEGTLLDGLFEKDIWKK